MTRTPLDKGVESLLCSLNQCIQKLTNVKSGIIWRHPRRERERERAQSWEKDSVACNSEGGASSEWNWCMLEQKKERDRLSASLWEWHFEECNTALEAPTLAKSQQKTMSCYCKRICGKFFKNAFFRACCWKRAGVAYIFTVVLSVSI